MLARVAGTWLTWDATALARAWRSGEVPNYGLAVASAPDPDAGPETAGDLLAARWFSAGDPATRPYLVIEIEVLPVTPTPVPTPTASASPLLPPAGSSARSIGWGGAGLVLAGAALLILGLAAGRGRRGD